MKPTPTPPPPTISTADLCAVLEVSPRRVNQMVKEGIIPAPVAHGQYPFIDTLRGVVKFHRDKQHSATDKKAALLAETIECRRLEKEKRQLELDESKRDVIPKSEVDSDIAAAVALIRGMLSAKFVTELPPQQTGLPADKIAEMNEAALVSVLAELHNIGRKK